AAVYEAVSAIANRLPTYCIFTGLCIDHGGIGGAYTDPRNDAVLSGELAARVLEGKRPDDIPLAQNSNLKVEVDWRELQKWHIPKSALPAGSVILYRPPSLWDSYRKYVTGTILLITALLLLIAGLLLERARKRKAEALLRESEKRFRVMAETTPTLVWMCDSQGKVTYLNERRLAFTGGDPKAGYGDSWIEYVHPDDVRNVKDCMAQGLKDRASFSREYRLRRSDGAYRWMFDVASPRLNGDGSFAGFIGSAIDVTDQKVAQQALEKVSGQLIEAQEKERRRIARDLHDDICQRLALLSMELDQANRSAHESADATKQRLGEIRQHCSEIAVDVQSLSHELHSSKLDYLGITAAIRGFCLEFSKQHEVSIKFTDRNVPAKIPREISLCFFRVTQEALHNAVKYSGVRDFRVELTATAEEIQLAVSDAGRGFDVEAARKHHGLGLVSMQERVHLVHGSLFVESESGKGTKILAVVPLVSVRDKSESGMEEPEGVIGAV
ncbi:MAG TPA: PAS domain S-box protein, partial [Silvibacterium sp.]|nr:PAS domain S-box protein [Silvibacterium sp.]